MSAQTAIKHALNQGVSAPASPLCADTHGIEWREAPTCARGVSLVKATDTVPATPMILVLDMGWYAGHDDVVTRVFVNLDKSVRRSACSWCCGDETVPALYTAEHADGWTDSMCGHHAMVYGRFVPASVLQCVAGWIDSRTAAFIVGGGEC